MAGPGTQGDAGARGLRAAAKIELGMRAFLANGHFKAFTTSFEQLHGMEQLPGLAVQRLMADGYGFGAEGDWKTAALVRAMKVMGAGLPGGTSFMEDYTYHLAPGATKVLGAHMLEICASLSDGKPSLELHPLGIGGKADPARLVFNAVAGPAVNATIIDMGTRMRMIVNEVDVVKPDRDLPRLPVARAFWAPRPSLKVAARGLDLRRRRPSFRLFPGDHGPAPGDVRRDGRHRMRAHRRPVDRIASQEGTPLERGLLFVEERPMARRFVLLFVTPVGLVVASLASASLMLPNSGGLPTLPQEGNLPERKTPSVHAEDAVPARCADGKGPIYARPELLARGEGRDRRDRAARR